MSSRWKRWIPRRAAVALLSAVLLVAGVCHVEGASSPTDEQFRLPSHTEAVAAASASRVASALHQRPQPWTHEAVFVVPFDPRATARIVFLPGRGEGSLPPNRRRYRRVVHDDSGDPPA